MLISHKIELYPNNIQKTYLNKSFGVSRFSYNWALTEWNKQRNEGKKTNILQLKKEFNAIKKTQFPWTMEVTKWACQQPFINLNKSVDRFFKKKSKYPRYKKKGKNTDSFYIEGSCVKILNGKVKIPILRSLIKMSESVRFSGKINSVTFSKTADRYFASFQIQTDSCVSTINKGSVGVDLGVKSLIVTSDGHVVESLKPLKRSLKLLKRQQRKLTKKIKGSKNREKQKAKLAKIHHKISCKRKDILHKTTTFLVNNYSNISIEDLNVKGMVKNHNLAQSISDAGFGEFKRQLEYKSKMTGVKLTVINRFYPSSKTCSNCGEVKKDLTLKNRVYSCPNCSLVLDRDLNAAININKIGRAPTEFTPVEITALQKAVHPYFVSSINETGIKHQTS